MSVYKVEIRSTPEGYYLTLDGHGMSQTYKDFDRVVTVIRGYFNE